MVVIGITGGICSVDDYVGKSTVTRLLADLGAKVIDADKLGHQAYEPGCECYHNLIKQFGASIISDDEEKSINRRVLGSMVFSDSQAMKSLQDIVWPEIRRLLIESIERLKHEGERIIVIEAAVMIEAGWYDLMDSVWIVEVPRETAITRLMARNGLSREESEKRFDSQISHEERIKYASVVINNDGDNETLQLHCQTLWNDLRD